MGPNVLDIIQHFEEEDKKMKLWLVKLITRQVLAGLVYMHEACDLIHTDIKPENIMVDLEKEELDDLVSKLREYKKKPLSMKFLQKIKESGNAQKNKKKYEKKKLKKKLQKEADNQKDGEEEESTQLESQSSSTQAESNTNPEPTSNANPNPSTNNEVVIADEEE